MNTATNNNHRDYTYAPLKPDDTFIIKDEICDRDDDYDQYCKFYSSIIDDTNNDSVSGEDEKNWVNINSLINDAIAAMEK